MNIFETLKTTTVKSDLIGHRYCIMGTLKIVHVGLIIFICRGFAILHDCIENYFGSDSKNLFKLPSLLNFKSGEGNCIKLLVRKKSIHHCKPKKCISRDLLRM